MNTENNITDAHLIAAASCVPYEQQHITMRLRIRAAIRRNAKGRKSVEEGKEDRLAKLLDQAADEIERLENLIFTEDK